MTKSQRRKTKLEGRPEWTASKKTCEECGNLLVHTRSTTYICTSCGLIQEKVKPRIRKKIQKDSGPKDPNIDNPPICPECKEVFSSSEVLRLHLRYSGHDNGILAPVIAHMLGASVIEKHFTLNHAWKGTDHKFSLEPEGLRKQVRDLRRVKISIGDSKKILHDFELEARKKMGKGIYTARPIPAGTVLTLSDICLKSPATNTPPYLIGKIIGKRLITDLDKEYPLSQDLLE